MFPWNWFGQKNQDFDPLKNINGQDIQKWLDHWMKDVFPRNFWSLVKNHDQKPTTQNRKQTETIKIQESIFETFDDMYIRLPIENKFLIKRIKIYYTPNKCFIEGLQPQPYTILLPAIAKKKGARAIYREQWLEIKIPKNLDLEASEIEISQK